MLRVSILVATQSGNALMVAEVIAERLVEAQIGTVRVLPEGSVPADLAFNETDVLICCIATHGDGDLPDGFRLMYEQLLLSNANLSHLRYGIIALGDRTYKQFCGGGRKVDALLTRLGARRVGEVHEIDASAQPFPDNDALEWVERWRPCL